MESTRASESLLPSLPHLVSRSGDPLISRPMTKLAEILHSTNMGCFVEEASVRLPPYSDAKERVALRQLLFALTARSV